MTEKTKKKVYTRTTVRLPEDVHHRAKVMAAQLRMSVQDFVTAAVADKLAGEPKIKHALRS